MSELQSLYQQVILAHYRAPKGVGRVADPTHEAELDNPLCGDRAAVSLCLERGRLAAIACEAAGCAIVKASASLMASSLSGLDLEDALALRDRVEAWIQGSAEPDAAAGELQALAALREFPSRQRCGLLPWQCLTAAVEAEIGEP